MVSAIRCKLASNDCETEELTKVEIPAYLHLGSKTQGPKVRISACHPLNADLRQYRLYQLDNMTSPNPRPNMMYAWKGFAFPEKGWR
jgi:hypothetical protein